MPCFRNILVAVDLSDHSQEVFRIACALAREGESQLVVVHVIDDVHVLEEAVILEQLGLPVPIGYIHVGRHENVQRKLIDLYRPDPPMLIDYVTRQGDVAEQILRLAEQRSCDLIVMGTHGRKGLERALLGSAAEAVMHQALCAVVTVRMDPAQPDAARSPQPGSVVAESGTRLSSSEPGSHARSRT
jgi:universal stress protein A